MIEVAGGESCSGVTVGGAEHDSGLCLYVPAAEGGVRRTFVPARAIVSLSLDGLGPSVVPGMAGRTLDAANSSDVLCTQKLARSSGSLREQDNPRLPHVEFRS